MKTTMTTAAIAAMVLSASVAMAAADPVCGDVNSDQQVKTTDALLVLKKSVDQPITLDCSGYDERFAGCETSLAGAIDSLAGCDSDLAACKNASVCGDGSVGAGEDCDVGNLDSETCATQPGFIGGTLACATGCTFDTTGCYATRFDASGATIIDNQTGLEWEKKDSADDAINIANPHDVDNSYQWSSTGTAPDGGAFTDFLGRLNGGTSSLSTGPTIGCYAGHCDWRLPTVEELQNIVDLSASGCALGSPCIDPAFGPTLSDTYWASSTLQADPTHAWDVDFEGLWNILGAKMGTRKVRAVRTGS